MIDRVPRFITPANEPDSAPLFRRDLPIDEGHGAVVSARLTLSALGIVEAWINGTPVSNDLLTPGWTSYEWRLHSVTHDVTALMAPQSTMGIAIGNGWYRGRLGWIPTQRYGDRLAAYAELRLVFEDAHEQVIVTDESWQVGPSSITANDFYDGQSIDARLADDDWKQPGFSSPLWGAVRVLDYAGAVVSDPVAPVRRIAELAPQRVWSSESGSIIVDFGQNIVGFLRLTLRGESGQVVTARHAEVLDGGRLATRPLRTAAATDRFTLSGGVDTFEPSFTFHGFRYAELEGWPGQPDDVGAAVRAVVIGTDLHRTGHFACSVPELNQLHENVVRGMRGNFIDIPTDCPQRDERLGWTGDISAFAPTAAYLFDVQQFLADWLVDVGLEQSHHGGVVPYTVPDILKYAADPPLGAGSPEATAIWSDASVWVPWALWEAYGDPQVLRSTVDSMVAHGRRVRSLLSPSGVWDAGFQFGDWLDPDAPPDRPGAAKADRGVVATACAYRTAVCISAVAELLDRPAEHEEFARMATELRAAFQREYVGDQRISSDCATVYVLAIVFGLLDSEQSAWAGARLAELVAASGDRISTGFAGTPFVMDALTMTGHIDTAYRLLLQRECPSWLYPVTMGATTVWERWDSMLPDGSINPGDMTSFNHYALGAVADWMHRSLGGLAPLEPGYRRMRIAPQVAAGIDWASTSLETPHGLAAVHWRTDGELVRLQVTIPSGTTAVVVWPGDPDLELRPGSHELVLPRRVARVSDELAR